MAALIFGSTYNTHLKYPMNASFAFSLCACTGSLLYVASLLISVQFRGDFGVMSDEAIIGCGSTAASSGSRSVVASSPLVYQPGFDTDPQLGGGGVSDIFEVPLGDISLLVSHPMSGYSSRLHNLKIDIKEV